MKLLSSVVVVVSLLALGGCCKKSSAESSGSSSTSTTTTTTPASTSNTRDQCSTLCNDMFKACPNNDKGIPACVSVCMSRTEGVKSCYNASASSYGAAKCSKASSCVVALVK